MIRVKMKVVSVDSQWHPNSEGAMIKVECIYDGSPDNKSWSKWTPSGHIILNVTNLEAVKQFTEWMLDGIDVAVDFSKFGVE